MTDRVYPSAKPAATNGTTAAAVNGGGPNPAFPATKAQLYNATRPMYRPQPPAKHRHRRSCCCACCLWTTLLIILIVFLAAIAGAVLWVLYRPHRPSFTVTNLQLSQFNLTSNQVTSKFNLTVIARNPNKKITFFYDPVDVKVYADGVHIGEGSFQGFVHGRKNTTALRSVITNPTSDQQQQEGTDISPLKNKKNLGLKIKLDTKVKVKIGGLKTKKVGIRVTCEGIKVSVPTGKSATTATTSGAKCKVDLRIKILKWHV